MRCWRYREVSRVGVRSRATPCAVGLPGQRARGNSECGMRSVARRGAATQKEGRREGTLKELDTPVSCGSGREGERSQKQGSEDGVWKSGW